MCDQCGAALSKWAGQCPECGQWNCVVEAPRAISKSAGRFSNYSGDTTSAVTRLAETAAQSSSMRPTGISELDRVLGGGLVPGAAILIAGDPGIGKSTVLLQLAAAVANDMVCLYVTGEESIDQIGMRARRLGVDGSEIRCLAETSVERILDHAGREKPAVLIVDSIQTLYTDASGSAPGSVSQVRDTAALLLRWGKQNGCAVILVGHVTKDGTLAGPRILEHMVDAVIYFESDSSARYRVLRAVKNRHGSVNELGMFAMTGTGLKEVRNPSAIFLSGHSGPVSGSAITVVREGTRPLLLEVQALVDTSSLNQPRRVALGLDPGRLAMILAVLHRKGGTALGACDVFINVVGGIRIVETGADLAMLCALHSAFHDRPLPGRMVCFGEVGLSGEIRPVADGEQRLREAAGHGFEKAFVPRANLPRKAIKNMEVIGLSSVAEAVELLADEG